MHNYGAGRLLQVIFALIIIAIIAIYSLNKPELKSTEYTEAKIVEFESNNIGHLFLLEAHGEQVKARSFTLLAVSVRPKVGDLFPIIINTHLDGHKEYLPNMSKWKKDRRSLNQ